MHLIGSYYLVTSISEYQSNIRDSGYSDPYTEGISSVPYCPAPSNGESQIFEKLSALAQLLFNDGEY